MKKVIARIRRRPIYTTYRNHQNRTKKELPILVQWGSALSGLASLGLAIYLMNQEVGIKDMGKLLKNQQTQIDQLLIQNRNADSQIRQLKDLNITALEQSKKTNDLLRASLKILSISETQRKNSLTQGQENLYRALERIETYARPYSIKGMALYGKNDEVYNFFQSVLPIYDAEISNPFIITDNDLYSLWEKIPRQIQAILYEIDNYDVFLKDREGIVLMTKAEKDKWIRDALLIYYDLHITLTDTLRKKYPSINTSQLLPK